MWAPLRFSWPCRRDRDPQPVRRFPTFTADLRQIWRRGTSRCHISTVAMESTGVYWIPPHEILEEAGIRVCLVGTSHVKHVPGRKSDVQDCRWLQYLHSITACSRPPSVPTARSAPYAP